MPQDATGVGSESFRFVTDQFAAPTLQRETAAALAARGCGCGCGCGSGGGAGGGGGSVRAQVAQSPTS
jgi:hypothetical protein